MRDFVKFDNCFADAGYMDTVELLIEAKADVNSADDDGWTPLHRSVFKRKSPLPSCSKNKVIYDFDLSQMIMLKLSIFCTNMAPA